MRSSLQMAWRRPWKGERPLSARVGTRRLTSSRMDLEGFALEAAGDLLHGDQADAAFVASVEGFVEVGLLVEPGGVLDHDGVDEADLGGGLEDGCAVAVVGGDAEELEFAGLLGGFGGGFEFGAAEELEGGVDAVVAEAVDEEEVEVVGAHRFATGIEHGGELAGDGRGFRVPW